MSRIKIASTDNWQVQRYRQRISGSLLDQIDLHIEVPAVQYRDISSTRARARTSDL